MNTEMPRFKLISHYLCPYVQRARIVLDEKAIEHELEFIDLSNKPHWFLSISPLGKVPVLLVDDRPIFESAPIVEFLDEVTPGSLHPRDPFDKAENRAWIQFASDTLDSIGALYNAKEQERFELFVNRVRERFRSLENRVSGDYFNGTEFSLVDAAFGPVFRYFDVIDKYLDLGIFGHLTRVRHWRHCLSARPSIRGAVVGDYGNRLKRFLLGRNSILSDLIGVRDVA